MQVSIKTPVKKEILELQATQSAKPAPAANESTWAEPVVYNTNKSGGNKEVEISASEATVYKNYTLVTFKVKNISVSGVWTFSLRVGKNESNPDDIGSFYQEFYGAEILRGTARTGPLQYQRPKDSGDSQRFAVLTGASPNRAPSSPSPGDTITFPVLFPTTKDKTITIDASAVVPTGKNKQYGWRINDIPVKPAKATKSKD
ncbi:hypothetical protein [Mobiluncus porci]|uniref:Uncharacterized protein n=1 Tax=Mobiluncus porci TaxID=2652278 RepID=A0A7K0K1N8_9ACTO|nr:hypothetical protein [Mobiluncus porci]MST48955.1 hypothetical protein [Mobiluncus porci]